MILGDSYWFETPDGPSSFIQVKLIKIESSFLTIEKEDKSTLQTLPKNLLERNKVI